MFIPSMSLFLDKQRHHSLCLITIFKNESHILQEFISHYLREGVDHFFMIDNGSTDSYLHILQPYIDKDLITLVIDPTRHIQVSAMNHYFLESCKNYHWALVCDLDEFVYSRKGFLTIRDYLLSLNDDVRQIFIPWKMFASNGHVSQPISVIASFTKRVDYDKASGFQGVYLHEDSTKYSLTKTIARTRFITHIDIHSQSMTDGTSGFITTSLLSDICSYSCTSKIDETILADSALHLNHYCIQSFDWFMSVKVKRGDASQSTCDTVRDETYFRNYDINDIDDVELSRKWNLDGILKTIVENKVGVEIGGPSLSGHSVIYPAASSMDNIIFNSNTVWSQHEDTYIYYEGKTGKVIINDAVDISSVGSDAYDFLFASHCLEHIANPLKAVSEWIRVVKNGGYLIFILPEKSQCFDHRRSVSMFSTLLTQYEKNVGEDDLSTLPEILKNHDLSMDPPAGDLGQFTKRSLDNYNNRCLHHYVYSPPLLKEICDFFHCEFVFTVTNGLDIWFIMKKVE
jgi:SAM-dependent methyltransferase